MEILPRHEQRESDTELYRQFLISHPRGTRYFMSRSSLISLKPHNIRKARKLTKSNFMSKCEYCEELYQHVYHGKIIEPKRLTKLKTHNKIAKHQQKAFKTDRATLKDDEALLQSDFSKFYSTNPKVINDLVIVITTKKGGEYLWNYYDYFSSEKQTAEYVWAVWEKLLAEGGPLHGIKKIKIWSDGCGGHFKQRYMFWIISGIKMRFGLEITWNFFASYHGHSICDSHTGVAKQAIMRQQIIAQGHVSKEILLQTVSKLKNTFISEVNEIMKRDFEVSQLKGIKAYHEWIPIANGTFYCREISGEGEQVLQTIKQVPKLKKKIVDNGDSEDDNEESNIVQIDYEEEAKEQIDYVEEAKETSGTSVHTDNNEEDDELGEKEEELDILSLFSSTRTRFSQVPSRYL